MKTIDSYTEHRDAWLATAARQGHTLRLDDDGEINLFVLGGGYCNGPGCETCGWSTCMHCTSMAEIPECSAEARAEHVRREAEWSRRAQLQALAPDHALLLAALVSGRVLINTDQWFHEEGRITLKVPGWARLEISDIDPFGCPVLSNELRTELLKRAGEEPGG